ncbi:unnamed protein product [Symbiodinium natans]|uniref:Uncharacterized protein n=1 Tax=Symbiodinium natans TaxID=878477 RepID=A0A812VA59_9DINO|nr:unnamed protein product [Symbiodinium natans]
MKMLYQDALADPYRLACVSEMYHQQDPPPPMDPSSTGVRYMNDIMHDISNPAQMAIRQVARSFACSHYKITPFLGKFRNRPNTDTVIHPELIHVDPYSNKQDTTDYPLVQVLVIPLRTTKPPPHAHDANSPSPPKHKGAYKAYWSHATDEAGLWHILREGFVRPTNWEPTNWDDDNLPYNKAYLPHRGFNGFHQDNSPDNLQLGFCHTNLRKALRLPKARAGPAEREIATGFTIFGRVTSSTSQHSHMRQKGGGWTTQKALIEAHFNDTSRASRNFTTVFSHTEKSVIDAQYAEITGITINTMNADNNVDNYLSWRILPPHREEQSDDFFFTFTNPHSCGTSAEDVKRNRSQIG